MKNEPIIHFDHVRKKYRRGQTLLLKQALLDMFKPNSTEDFWALDDVSFTINRGEAIGVIGTNGSGKSTILKLIAGVTQPTSGKITVNGKISPLIELGAGFHPELTGRENVYLNGTILGLTKKEIDERFNDIVAFAELQDFIDSPVKHYSSGMYMRLGFAVAVHVNPEILLIDEILAVGDAPFQEKCLRKMESFKQSDITIVFVSHNADAIAKFCNRVLYIEHGKLKFFGETKKGLDLYQKASE